VRQRDEALHAPPVNRLIHDPLDTMDCILAAQEPARLQGCSSALHRRNPRRLQIL
jgi:hypothetical protein